jgi:nitrogen regulatory protein P-II 1
MKGCDSMVLLALFLSDETRIEDILEAFLEIGITGASVLSAHGMGEILSREVPIFAGLRDLFPGGEGQHRFIMSVTSRDKAAEAIKIINRICGSLTEKGTGIAFTIPVEEVHGLAGEL